MGAQEGVCRGQMLTNGPQHKHRHKKSENVKCVFSDVKTYTWTMYTVCRKLRKHFCEPKNAPEERDERNNNQRSRGKRAEGQPKEPFGREKGPQGKIMDSMTPIGLAVFGP